MSYSCGDVVLVRFPFTNQAVFKQRPAVVISTQAYNSTKPDVIILAITSQFRFQAVFGELWITDWQAANLLKPSSIKPVFATIEQGLILKHLGSLLPADQTALRQSIASILG